MKKLFALAAAALITGFAALLSGGAPGSATDPLVSKSYVDQRIDEISAGGMTDAAKETLVSEAVARLEPLLSARAGLSYAPVRATLGQTIIGGEGAEIILRSGTADAVSASPDGLADVTGGFDIGAGSTISLNHLLIVPRGDGRGALITSQEAWFLIKGRYMVR
jgi:F0F1-type ATP synthase membrane subunit c/vacuolar-type H+-ATPase subunit K